MRKIDNTDFTYLHTADGSTPLSIADAIIRDIGDDEDAIIDVIFYLKVYLNRVYGNREVQDADCD